MSLKDKLTPLLNIQIVIKYQEQPNPVPVLNEFHRFMLHEKQKNQTKEFGFDVEHSHQEVKYEFKDIRRFQLSSIFFDINNEHDSIDLTLFLMDLESKVKKVESWSIKNEFGSVSVFFGNKDYSLTLTVNPVPLTS